MKRSNLLLLLSALCLTRMTGSAADTGFAVRESPDRCVITCDGRPVATYVFRDDRILRPYFCNVYAPGGIQVTRNHPPMPGKDATDHDTMHPGLWLAFGDISGQDFWRNKGRIEHVRFIQTPRVAGGRLIFATQCRLLAADGTALGSLTNRFTAIALTNNWLLVWDATFCSADVDLTFGDQEEMGLGVRVATGITEKNGGTILTSTGAKTAKATWGKSFEWCDYAGELNGQRVGLTLMPDPGNFRPSWWHNRDYGLMVANPFGREALKQGARSAVTVKRGESIRLCFGTAVHQGRIDNPGTLYQAFLSRNAGNRQ